MKMVIFVLCLLTSLVGLCWALLAIFSPILFALGYIIGLSERVLTMADLTAMLGGLALFCITLIFAQLVGWMYTDWI